MNQAVMLINCYLYGATVVMLLVLLLIVYLRGQVNHFPNPFVKKNLVYQHPAQAKGILFGKKFGLLGYSPEQDEGHILVLGPSGTGKTSALLIPTLRSWQGTALVVDISGDISANVNTPNKIIFDPTSESCIPYDVFASINAVTDDTERQERLEQLAYLLLPDKANDSEAGIFFCKNGRKMITAALICYYGMGWGFVEICEFVAGEKCWGVKDVDVYMPAAMQNDVRMESAEKIAASGVKYYIEVANMPTTNDALNFLRQQKGIIVAPSKAVNAGGVGVSALEMAQNSERLVWTAEEVDAQLHKMMKTIHKESADAAAEYGLGYDLVAGANIAGFKKVAEAMMEQGCF